MANIENVDIKGDRIFLTLRIGKPEWAFLQSSTKHLLVLPTEKMGDSLTTGRLGNSNRIMLPSRVMARHRVAVLPKKVPARIFELDDERYLLIQLHGTRAGVPAFGEVHEG